MSGERQRRTVQVTVRMTPDERHKVRQAAGACRLSTAAYLRRAALGTGARRRRHAADRAALRRLDAVALKLDRLARQARRRDQPAIEDELRELAERVRSLVVQRAAVVREENP